MATHACRMWDIINEPRCPGCKEAWQQQAVIGFLEDVGQFIKENAPNQLVAAGTEGGLGEVSRSM